MIENDCLCPISSSNFVVLYLTIALVLCVMVAFILDGPCMLMDKCKCFNKCRDAMDLLVHLAEYGGGYFFAAFLFVLRCNELHKRWDQFEENSHFYIQHITFSDVFFILFCIATLIWIIFSVRKWCKRNYGDIEMSVSKIRESIRSMELSALTVNEDSNDDDEKVDSADL